MACDFSAFSGLGRASISRRLQVAGSLNFPKPLFGLEGLQVVQSEATPKIWKATGPSSLVFGNKYPSVASTWCILVSCASHVHQVYRRAPLQTCGPRRATQGKTNTTATVWRSFSCWGRIAPQLLHVSGVMGGIWVGSVGVDVKFPCFCAPTPEMLLS